VHDPKDPGADLGPMFSQVVSTILRLTDRHAQSWLGIEGSHDAPIYGFERVIDPPPLEINTRRLLEQFAAGHVTVAEVWEAALDPATFGHIARLARDAADAVEASVRADRPRAVEESGFAFPDETWSRVIYDVCLAARAGDVPIDRLVASLIPIYFGRVAGLVIETRELTTDQAEAFVERQARAYELAKPQFVERWNQPTASVGNRPRRPAAATARR
jgi:hypothetical protein